MKYLHRLAPLALAGLAAPALAQDVGTSIPERVELDSFAQIPVKKFEDIVGRAVLLEFFAYW